MAETYDSVLDRIGAFNAATEALSKGRASEVIVEVVGRPELRLRLAKTAENYSIEVSGAPASEALDAMGFKPAGDSYARDVRKSERSWNVASQLEDILQEVFQLPSDVPIQTGAGL